MPLEHSCQPVPPSVCFFVAQFRLKTASLGYANPRTNGITKSKVTVCLRLACITQTTPLTTTMYRLTSFLCTVFSGFSCSGSETMTCVAPVHCGTVRMLCDFRLIFGSLVSSLWDRPKNTRKVSRHLNILPRTRHERSKKHPNRSKGTQDNFNTTPRSHPSAPRGPQMSSTSPLQPTRRHMSAARRHNMTSRRAREPPTEPNSPREH